MFQLPCCGSPTAGTSMESAPGPCRQCLWRRVLVLRIAALVCFFLCATVASLLRGGLEGNQTSAWHRSSGRSAGNFHARHRRLQQDLASGALDEAVDDSLACNGCTPDDKDDQLVQRAGQAGDEDDHVRTKQAANLIQCAEVGNVLPEQRCESAQTCEGGGRGLVNYMALHFCWLQEVSLISVPLLVGGVVVAFYFLAETAEHYFSPAVAYMVTMLRLTPSTGGVTLLALGNGAPDLFASLAAINGGNYRIGLGAILSAGTFVSTFVVGCVALAAAPFTVSPLPFTRDILFYAFAVCMLFVVYISGVVYFWQAVGFIGFYAVFVVVVIFTDQVKGRKDGKQIPIPAQKTLTDESRERDELLGFLAVPGRTPWALDVSKEHSKEVESDMLLVTPPETEIGVLSSDEGRSGFQGPRFASRKVLDKVVSSYVRLSNWAAPWVRAKPRQQHKLPLVQDFNTKKADTGCCGKPTTIWKLHLPAEVLLKATIPAVNPANWKRGYATANIVLCPLLVLYMCSTKVPFDLDIRISATFQLPLWFLVLGQSLLVGTMYYLMSKEPPDGQHMLPISLAFVMSVLWISFMAGELLGCLAALGVILRIPPALLGLTVLAWGNSMGDLVADVAVARNGQPALAMAGCFAGPMFNMLIGLGLALAMSTSEIHSSGYSLTVHPSILIAFGFLFIGLLGSLLVMMRYKFLITRGWGITLICWYLFFMAVSIVFAGLTPY